MDFCVYDITLYSDRNFRIHLWESINYEIKINLLYYTSWFLCDFYAVIYNYSAEIQIITCVFFPKAGAFLYTNPGVQSMMFSEKLWTISMPSMYLNGLNDCCLSKITFLECSNSNVDMLRHARKGLNLFIYKKKYKYNIENQRIFSIRIYCF